MLYNHSAALEASPEGWHLPTIEDLVELKIFLGMSESEANLWGNQGTDEGGKLKTPGFEHWTSPNTGATNESGFSALPGGLLGVFVNSQFFFSGAGWYLVDMGSWYW